MEQFYFESPEVEFVVEIINSYSDDVALMKRKVR